MQHYFETGLDALSRANDELASIESSAEWQSHITALADAKRAYEDAVNVLKSSGIYAKHEQAVQSVNDIGTALRADVITWWNASDKSQKSIGRVGVRISTKYAVSDNAAFVQALKDISPNRIEKLVKKIEVNQGSIAETATLLGIPLTATETVSVVVRAK